LVEAGIKPGQDRILDPASGGRPSGSLAERIPRLDAARCTRQDSPSVINDTLHGVEIEAGLAKLSRALLTDLLDAEIESSGINSTA